MAYLALIIASFIFGAGFGWYFRATVLIPVILLTPIGIGTVGLACQLSVGITLLALASVATALQLGYLGGCLLRYASAKAMVDGSTAQRAETKQSGGSHLPATLLSGRTGSKSQHA
jgi:hypothetical protein